MFKVDNKDTRMTCRFDVFIVDSEHISHLVWAGKCRLGIQYLILYKNTNRTL